MRSVSFDKAVYLDAFPTGVTTTGTFRIYNYSFVNADKPVTWTVSYQKVAVANGYPEAPDLSKATRVTSGTVPFIDGREADPIGDNWVYVPFTWTTPSDVETGYLHVQLTYPDAQLSVDNDWGYVYVGTYAFTGDMVPKSANGASAKTGAVDSIALDSYESWENLDLRIDVEDLTVRDVEGNVLDPNALPQDKPFYIDCAVALDETGNGAAATGTPIVYLELFVNGESRVASQHTPYMGKGTKHKFEIRYDPTLHKDLVHLETLVLEATSHLGVETADANADNHKATMRFAGTGAGENTGGSSGCNAGAAGVLALFALGFVLAERRK
jgi:hypothetical protein